MQPRHCWEFSRKFTSSNTCRSLQCQLSLPSASNDGMHWADLWGYRRALKLGVVRFNGEEKGLRHGEYRDDLREAFTADTVSVHVQYFISNLENTRFGLKIRLPCRRSLSYKKTSFRNHLKFETIWYLDPKYTFSHKNFTIYLKTLSLPL